MAMRSPVAILLMALLCLPAAAVQQQAGITAVQKVIQMLEDMRSSGKQEKDDEIVRFVTYRTFCDKTKAEKQKSIAKGKADIEKLEADIGKGQEETLTIAKAIAGHDADIAAWKAEKDEVTAQRAKEMADYQQVYNDYTQAMSEGSRVAATIKAGNAPQSLVQLQTHLSSVQGRPAVTPAARRLLGVFLQETDSQRLMNEATGAPDAKTYESQSFGALGIVEDMVEQFEDKRNVLEKEEMKKAGAFDLVKADLMDSIGDADSEREEKVSRTQEVQQEMAQATADLERTKVEVANDEKFLSDLTTECEQKSVDFEKRQVARAGEITAVGKAIEIMSGSAVSTGTGNLGLAQTADATSLAQLRTVALSDVQKTVAGLLADRAHKVQSKILSLISTRVAAEPFGKVVKMIREMIEKLMTEGNEEAEHKAFCDTELGTNQQTREEKSDQAEELTAQMEKATADIKRLTGQIAELSDDITENDAAVAKATAERSDEKAKNAKTISESRAAAAATLKAINVLRDFYQSQAEAAALAQVRAGVPGSPETFDAGSSPIQGGSSTGVIGMLETIESDFKRLDAETTASEMQADGDYKKFMTESQKDKAVKTADMKAKADMKLETESNLLNAKKDLKSTNEELTAALEYFDKLKPSCVEAGVSYEERVAKRKQEIESLKEALQILNDSAPAAA